MLYNAMPNDGRPWPISVVYHMGNFQNNGKEQVCIITMTFYRFRDDSYAGIADPSLDISTPEMIKNWSPITETYCSTEQLLTVLFYELSACSEHQANATEVYQAAYRQAFAHLDDLLVKHAHIPWLKRSYANNSLRRHLPKSCALLEELLEQESNSRMQGRKARLIQQHWRRIVADPYHQVCRRRLAREFSMMPSPHAVVGGAW